MKGKESKTSRELQVGGSQPPFSSPIPLFHGSCLPPRISRDPNKDGGEGAGGENVQVLPGQGSSEETAGYPWPGGGKGQHRKQRAGVASGPGQPPAPDAGVARPGAILSLYRTLCPPTWQLPRAAAARSSRSTAGTRGTRGSLASAPPVRGFPDLAGMCRGGEGGGCGKGRAGENGGVAGAREGTQHSRPAPRVAPPQRDTGGTDAARNARPRPLTWGGGGRL